MNAETADLCLQIGRGKLPRLDQCRSLSGVSTMITPQSPMCTITISFLTPIHLISSGALFTPSTHQYSNLQRTDCAFPETICEYQSPGRPPSPVDLSQNGHKILYHTHGLTATKRYRSAEHRLSVLVCHIPRIIRSKDRYADSLSSIVRHLQGNQLP